MTHPAEQPGPPQSPRPIAAPAVASSGSESVPADARASDGRALILAVERDPHVRALEEYFLQEAGYAVAFATDGVAALAMARSLIPDIIITEILVPKLDGLALCRAVKGDPSLNRTAIVVFSILAAETRAREAGADAFLMKPLAERRLVDTVRALLALHEGASATVPKVLPPFLGSRP